MTWCIHNACRIRDKAQRPSAFKSQPSGRLTCSTPELGAQFQLNLTKKPKKKDTTPWKHVLLPDHVQMAAEWLSLETTGRSLSRLKTMHWLSNENGEARKSGQLFNTSTSTNEKRKRVRPSTAASGSTQRHRRVRQGKKARCSLYLNELLIQKCKIRHRFTVNC